MAEVFVGGSDQAPCDLRLRVFAEEFILHALRVLLSEMVVADFRIQKAVAIDAAEVCIVREWLRALLVAQDAHVFFVAEAGQLAVQVLLVVLHRSALYMAAAPRVLGGLLVYALLHIDNPFRDISQIGGFFVRGRDILVLCEKDILPKVAGVVTCRACLEIFHGLLNGSLGLGADRSARAHFVLALRVYADQLFAPVAIGGGRCAGLNAQAVLVQLAHVCVYLLLLDDQMIQIALFRRLASRTRLPRTSLTLLPLRLAGLLVQGLLVRGLLVLRDGLLR